MFLMSCDFRNLYVGDSSKPSPSRIYTSGATTDINTKLIEKKSVKIFDELKIIRKIKPKLAFIFIRSADGYFNQNRLLAGEL